MGELATGSPPDNFAWPAVAALDDVAIPMAGTRDSAIGALRLAKEQCRYHAAPRMVHNLIAASLAYFEANA